MSVHFKLWYVFIKTLQTGLFIGRFQPFHLGHLNTVKFALGQVDELIIVVGSAQKSHEAKNPFTAGERLTMIRDSLRADKIDLNNILLIPVPDVDVHIIWTFNISMLVPKYDVVFSNDKFTSLLFGERGFRVIQPKLLDRQNLSATEVRSRISQDLDWKLLVPLATAHVIDSVGGVDRVKALMQHQRDSH